MFLAGQNSSSRAVSWATLGSSNAINIVHATVEALRSLEEPEAVAARRGKSVEDVAPAALLRARAEGIEAAKAAPAGVQ